MARALVFLVCLAVGTAMAQPGYIRLQGDQFIDENGAPFFPMVMNYFIDFFYPSNAPPSLDPSAAELAPCGYGRSSFFGATGQCAYPSIAAGPASIVQDLHEMKAMGFNTIRYLSRVTKKAGDGHLLSIKAFPSGQDELFLNLDPPYDPQANLVFEFQMNTVLQVCSLANTVGMKVLFEIGGDVHALDLNADWPEIQDHLDYIEAIATFIEAQDVTNLLAYEFYGEPTFTDGRPEVLPKHTRAQICEIAHAWNQRLKQVDPGHLTTIGGVFMDDLWREGWDPLLLEVDFATMHLYLLHDRFEHDDDPSTFLDKATKRYADMLYEYDRFIRKPYIITETGFQGQDNPNGYPSYAYPYLLGSEQDQDDFLRATFPLVLGSRCAGYGWWVFQNIHWYADPPPWPPIPNDPNSPQDYSNGTMGSTNRAIPDRWTSSTVSRATRHCASRRRRPSSRG
ncbi:MAG: hypothetical protein IPL52_07395 [Flavobacteriales bacterium]|nr:hypothetical protein [Flavobacteriales bacterium]